MNHFLLPAVTEISKVLTDLLARYLISVLMLSLQVTQNLLADFGAWVGNEAVVLLDDEA